MDMSSVTNAKALAVRLAEHAHGEREGVASVGCIFRQEGQLLKRSGKKKSGGWTMRHFRLDLAMHELVYFKNAYTPTPKGRVQLSGATLARADADGAHSTEFVLRPSFPAGEEIRLRARSEQDMNDWMSSIGLVSDLGAGGPAALARFAIMNRRMWDRLDTAHHRAVLSGSSKVADYAPLERRAFLWTRTLLVTAIVCFLSASFLFCFSAMGRGEETFRRLSARADLTSPLLVMCGAIAVLMYLSDASYWHGRWHAAKVALLITLALGVVLAAIISIKDFPALPMGLYILATVFVLSLCRQLCCSRPHLADYFRSISYALGVNAALMAAVFACWVFGLGGFGLSPFDPGTHYWNQETKDDYARRVDCEPQQGIGAAAAEPCLGATMLWGSPLVVVLFSTAFSVVTHFLSLDRGRGNLVQVEVRVFASILTLTIVGMWVAANVAGAGSKMASVVTSFSGICLVLLAGVVWRTIGWHTLASRIESVPLLAKMAQGRNSEWLKAAFLAFFAPIALNVMALSALNQYLRRKFRFASILRDEDVGTTRLTAVMSRQVTHVLNTWHWASVLKKTNLICIFIVVLSVGIGKVVTIGLSMLDAWLMGSGMSLGATTAIFLCIGIVMFLLPPVPGVPVYLAGGIILANAATKAGMSFGMAVVYASIISWLCKLLAVVGQQKGIGESMSDNLTVKRTVGVNSLSIHAIEYILRPKGVNFRKVCILCGGPDWPTSVLTGILKLSLVDMLKGALLLHAF